MDEMSSRTQTDTERVAPKLQEYHEVILHISGIQGQLRAQLSWRSMLEREGKESNIERQICLWQADTLLRDTKANTTKLVPSPQTLSELIKICSAQLREVASSGKQITVASRQMSSGIKKMQEGTGAINRKLARAKY